MVRSRLNVTVLSLLVGIASIPAVAEDVLPPVSERYAAANAAESPDFQRHVVPLLGKLGCNGRACHGSFQGRGGFRLSLFGYDFKMDHEGLVERIDTGAPDDSYALQKALSLEPHEGGKRFDAGSWEHHLFRKWIADGAQPLAKDAATLVRLDVTPSEVIYQAAGVETPLKAVAVWSDGAREDVTCLCRFVSNDEAIAAVTTSGQLTSGEPGDTHVVVFYDNAVVPVPVIRPVSGQVGPKYPQVATRTPIDAAVVEKLAKLGIVPADVCDDADFLRRVSLDVAGTLPTAAEVRAFLADSSPDKRTRKVNELLETSAYAAWWTTKICDWTGCNDNQLNNVNPAARQTGSKDWYDWVYARVAKNVPYDDLVEDIVVAESRKPDESYRDYCERMSDYYRKDGGSFADQPGLLYYWGRNNFRTDEDRAIGFAYTFMGTRIQCAQCHKHPFDVWTQEDFQQFEKFFTRVRFQRTGSDNKVYQELLKAVGADKLNGNDQRRAVTAALQDGKTIPFPEILVSSTARSARKPDAKRGEKKKGEPVAQMARLLGSEEVNLATIADPRTALMDWLRNDSKQLFAKAIVNRVWANYFHRGIVEPTDDLSLANPPANSALLDYLTKGFVAHGYDLKWLHREICASDTYQRSWRPNDTNAHDERNFSRAVPRRLPAEVAYDALQLATVGDQRAAAFCSNLQGRALAIPGVGRNSTNGPNYALTVFGRSVRESNCDCDRSAEASLLQVIFTRNDNEIYEMIDSRDGWAAQFSPPRTESTDRTTTRRRDVEKQLERAKSALKAATGKSDSDKKIASLQKRVDDIAKQLAKLQPAKPTEPTPAASTKDAARVVEDAYLRTLSRFPTEQEGQIARQYLTSAESLSDGAKDLLWTLLNTKEFIVNH